MLDSDLGLPAEGKLVGSGSTVPYLSKGIGLSIWCSFSVPRDHVKQETSSVQERVYMSAVSTTTIYVFADNRLKSIIDIRDFVTVSAFRIVIAIPSQKLFHSFCLLFFRFTFKSMMFA